MRNRVRRSVSILLFSWILPITTASAADCTHWAARIVSLQGEIEVRHADTSDWQAVKRNETFCPGDNIRVGNNSRAAFILANETLLRLNQNSSIKLTQLEPQTPSILQLIKGIGHFISRVPRSLKVETATVNAAIEGTEFVIVASANETSITVFEGTVLTQNKLGEVYITDGETVIAKTGQPPVKTLQTKPRDKVKWALYFPPIIEPVIVPAIDPVLDAVLDPNIGMNKSASVSSAAQLLSVGRVSDAQALLEDLNSAEARALKSIISIVNNETENAFRLAAEAVQQAPESAPAHIAMSYAWQAKLDLQQAVKSIQQAVKHEPNNAIAWARLAELQLSTGELDNALSSAEQATKNNASLSRTQSILGYAHLVRIEIEDAITVFNRAIELDQVDPLPHLGLGLAKIRRNDLKAGRREIEIAASLDPNNAIIRSYLGKAYFEEGRSPLDAVQFAMARALDPNDPTPFYYDAIRKQTENNPVGALEDLNKSIELNNNRAVYRSSLQLDQDEAARNASLAKIYHDLGFQQRALVVGLDALNTDPGNYSAHQFLADAYLQFTDRRIARVSELLQAQLLQPVSLKPLQTQLGQSGPFILQGAGPVEPAFNEYTPLFVSDGAVLQLNGVGGNNNTRGDDLTVSGINGRFLYSLGQFHYETDGFRPNNDLTHDSGNIFLQYDISHRVSLQFEYNTMSSEEGDRALSVLPFSNNERVESEANTSRIGLHYKPGPSSHVLVSGINQKKNEEKIFVPGLSATSDGDFSIVETQYIYNGEALNVLAGAGHLKSTNEIDFFGITTTAGTHNNAYFYSHFNCSTGVVCTLGANADSFDSDNNNLDTEQINPKLGVTWNINDSSIFRVAAFRTLNRVLPTDQTLEPTQVAGFNQFYDDDIATDSKLVGIAFDQRSGSRAGDRAGNRLFWGLEGSRRELDIPDASLPVTFDKWQENNYKTYFYQLLSSNTSLGLEYHFERFEREFVLANVINKIEQHEVPLFLRYHSPTGFIGKFQTRYVNQTSQSFAAPQTEYEDDFFLFDIFLGYRFAGKHGSIGLDIRNLFDTEFTYQDDSFRHAGNNNRSTTRFIPERTTLLKFSLLF